MSRSLLRNADALLKCGSIERRDILIEDSMICDIGSELSEHGIDRVFDLTGSIVSPGFVDIQVNGGGGVLFNDAPTFAGLKAIADAHLKLGVTAFLPTLISDDLAIVRAGIAAVDDAISKGATNIIGIHLEGPFLSPEKHGIHRPEYMRALDDADIDLLCSLKNGVTLITVAPEQVAPAQIGKMIERGAFVSLGHSNATEAEVLAALTAGARCFTHLYNAMSPITSRAPGMAGTALVRDDAWVSLILDGHHLSRTSTQLVFRSKPLEKCILISDAMTIAGTQDTTFNLQGREITVEAGRCVDEKGTLAGAALSLAEAVQHANSYSEVSGADALRMASLNPAKLLNIDPSHGSIEVGRQADLVCLSPSFELENVMMHGEWLGI